MAFDLLTTSGINSLVSSYTYNEIQKRIAPLETRKTKYTNISKIYSALVSKVDALKSKLSVLMAANNSSVFSAKTATSSNTNALTVSAGSSAQINSFSVRINQLAKNDLLVSLDKNSKDFSSIALPGTYSFSIKGGNGSNGQFTSNVSLSLTDSDFTNGKITLENLAAKISKAINDDKATVLSKSVMGSTLTSGSFTLNLNGTERTIDYSAGSYEDVFDNIISQLKDVSGLSAEKIVDGSNVQLKLTVTDSSNYITINGDTGSLVSELGIAVDKEKGASGIVSATAFSPSIGLTQISLTAVNPGSDFKIEEVSDINGDLLQEFGLNIGNSRPSFLQNENGEDNPGFVYDTSLLNSKITFNGLNIERNSNNISDLITGVSLNLKSVMSLSENEATVNIENDISSVKTKIDEFISAFNDVYSYIRTNSTSNNGVRGALLGDSSASSLLSLLSSTAYSPVSGIDSRTINSLSEMGITFNINTGLSITNTNQLNDVLQNKIEEVEKAFNSDNGIATNLYNKLLPYTGFSGYLSQRKDSFDNNVKSIVDTITQTQSKIDKESSVLRERYIQLQSQLNDLLSVNGIFGNDLFS